MEKFFHSVWLDENLCTGCTTCIRKCPTSAIRVRNGKAHIDKERCIDCGECIRVCPHHAKNSNYDHLDVLKEYKYTVALPAPSLYSQFNNIDDVNIILNGLIFMGFNSIFEVSAAAEIVSAATREYMKEYPLPRPLISTACPSIVRLIRVRFPNLIPHLLPLNPPIEVAAGLAAKAAMAATGLPREDIGIIFITPCPSKVTYVKSPLGVAKSEVDRVIATKEIYPELLAALNKVPDSYPDLSMSGKIGLRWASRSGEATGVLIDNYLAADGMDNIISVLEDLEDEKFGSLDFVELNACSGGCVGGVLNVENPFIAEAKLKQIRKYMPVSKMHLTNGARDFVNWQTYITYEPVFMLSSDINESFNMMSEIDKLVNMFPGTDCGSCGAPSCHALAEDIVKGQAHICDCIYEKLKLK